MSSIITSIVLKIILDRGSLFTTGSVHVRIRCYQFQLLTVLVATDITFKAKKINLRLRQKLHAHLRDKDV